VAILAADGVVASERLAGTVFIGELGLDGRLQSVLAVLPSVAAQGPTEKLRPDRDQISAALGMWLGAGM
jgi:predicted ATPase with chaperone activity